MWIIQSIQHNSQDNRNFEAHRKFETSLKFSLKTSFNGYKSEIQPHWQDEQIILFNILTENKYVFNKDLIKLNAYVLTILIIFFENHMHSLMLLM